MTITEVEIRNDGGLTKFLAEPSALVKATNKELWNIDPDVTAEIQLVHLKERFLYFQSRIKALSKLTKEQHITEIKELNDVVLLLFQHTVYKSYPLSLIEKRRFDKMTAWLDKLTTHDLSQIDTKGCKTIDEWLDRLEEQTELQVVHSSGTTGKLSFLPRSKTELENYKYALYLFIEALTGINCHKTKLPVFFPGFRDGRQLAQRVLGTYGPMLAGSEEEFHTAIPGFMSADFMSLAGRLQAAKAKGELGKLQMLKALTYNKGELLKIKRNRPKWMKAFFDNLITNYKGKQVFVMGTTVSLLEAALEGEKAGLSHVFAPNSGIISGGGMKGYIPPENWYERMCNFYGVKDIRDGYGMTETTGHCPSCKYNHYHIYPFLIPFVLDPDTGEALPRSDIQTGRFAFYDLLTESYWGGFITGDEVTIHWDDTCACGRKGPWLEKKIQRYSEKQGGTDKISCAGVQEAYDNFIDYLLELSEE
ncbi:MAG: LuxE/PaaK family acyltransferase [Candidatus Hodarchaeales archaeon]